MLTAEQKERVEKFNAAVEIGVNTHRGKLYFSALDNFSKEERLNIAMVVNSILEAKRLVDLIKIEGDDVDYIVNNSFLKDHDLYGYIVAEVYNRVHHK